MNKLKNLYHRGRAEAADRGHHGRTINNVRSNWVMRKLLFFLTLLTFSITGGLLASCGVRFGGMNRPSSSRPPSRKVETKAFDERAKVSGFREFDAEPLADDDTEIRVWANGGFVRLRGVMIRKREQKWTSYSLPPLQENSDVPNMIDLSDRFTDWDVFADDLADRLEDLGSSPPEKEVRFQDGQTVTVQLRKGAGPTNIQSSEEPCAQDSEVGASLCSVVKEIQRNLKTRLILLPD